MLDRLLGALDPELVQSQVICLAGDGPIAERIRARQVPLQVLGLPATARALAGLPRLIARLHEIRPDVIHTWMYHADFLGGIAGKTLGAPVIWALHATTLDPAQTRRATRWLVDALARLSAHVPERIVSCSQVGLEAHRSMGYDAQKLVVVPNGFDTTRFQKNGASRTAARARWGVSDDDIVIGHVARFHPQKDHRSLLAAAAICIETEPRLRFVCLGMDVSPSNSALADQARELGIMERCHFLGPTTSVENELPGFDLLVSSSRFGEAFPLVIGEAMACEVPCVVTDVGDSAFIVGDTGALVPPGDPGALADALLRMARLSRAERERLGAQARARIETKFSLAYVAELYTQVYRAAARADRQGG